MSAGNNNVGGIASSISGNGMNNNYYSRRK